MRITTEAIKQKLIDNNMTESEIEMIMNRISATHKKNEENRFLNRSLKKKIREILDQHGIAQNDYRVYHFWCDRVTVMVIRHIDCIKVAFSFASPEDYPNLSRREGIYNALINYTKNRYTYIYDKHEPAVESIYYATKAAKEHFKEFPGYNKYLDTVIHVDMVPGFKYSNSVDCGCRCKR